MATAVMPPQPAHVMQPFTRPIRFVANDGQPHAKRRRISAAYVTPDTPFSRTAKARDNISRSFLSHPPISSDDTAPTLPSHLYISSCTTMYPSILLEYHDVYICLFLALPYEDSSLLHFPWFF